MLTLRMLACSIVAGASLLGVASKASANGLVGIYVYPDAYRRGLVISGFIPGSSADQLRMRGELFAGDILTRYEGRRVYSAAQVRWISSMYPAGSWLRMEFMTPYGQRFWHWVQPGGGAAACLEPGLRGGAPAPQTYLFKKGSSRPRTGVVVPPRGPAIPPAGPGRPQVPGRGGWPTAAGRPSWPQSPGRPNTGFSWNHR